MSAPFPPKPSTTAEYVGRDRDDHSPQSPTDTVMSGETMTGDGRPVLRVDSSSAQSGDFGNEHGSDLEQGDSGAAERDHKRSWVSSINPFRFGEEPAEVTETNTRVLEETPDGYPRLGAFLSSEPGFAIYRSFNYLHNRVLLDLQAELNDLEKELDDADRFDNYPDRQIRMQCRSEDVRLYDDERTGQTHGHLNSNHGDDASCSAGTDRLQYPTRPRREILTDIKEKLYQYDKWLIKSRTLAGFQRPSDRNYRSVRRYINNTKPLVDEDNDPIRHKEDVLSLRNGRERAGFDNFVERSLQVIDQKILMKILRTERPPLQSFLRTPELQRKTSNKYINFYSSSRVDALIGMLITVIIFSLLIAPVIAMYRLGDKALKSGDSNSTFEAVGVMVIFTLLFSAAMSVVTRAARHELFAASAAYCAILVVFIGNFVAN